MTSNGRRLGAAALVLLALGFAGGAAFGGQLATPWQSLTGEDWRSMEPKERAAFLDGFLAGSGLADAEHAGARDSLTLMQTMTALRRESKLRYPFGPSVYESRLSDHYVWENHRPQPLWYGLREVNAQLRAATADSGR